MKNKFKIGDKVRRIKESHCGMEIGDIGTVIELTHTVSAGIRLKEYDNKACNAIHDISNFELVTPEVKQTNMKKFKNKLAVSGSRALLKAFSEELNSLGHVINDGYFGNFNRNEHIECILVYPDKDFTYGLYNHTGDYSYIKLYLPQDWDKALKLAAEVVIEVPEYVKCIKVPYGWSETKVNTTYKTCAKGFSDGIYRILLSGGGQTISGVEDHFIPSTKEAYGAQQQPKFKQDDWLYMINSKDTEILIRYNGINEKGNIITNEYYRFDRDKLTYEGTDQNYCTLSQVRLATKEEIEKILIQVAKSKYKIGDMVDQKTAYGGLGDINTIKGDNIIVAWNKYTFYYNVAINSIGVYNTKDAKWAEILPNEIKIKDYIITKISDNIVGIGHLHFNINDLNGLYCFLDKKGGGYSIDGKIWYASDVKQVIDEFNKMK